MTRRKLISYLSLSAGALVTGGLAAMGQDIHPDEAGLLRKFRAQIMEYPAITPDLLDRLSHPVRVLNRQPGSITFLNSDGKTIHLSLHKGVLRAATY